MHQPESIADHMYRMSLMCFISGRTGLDVNHIIKLSLMHDIAESLVGDITPHDGVSDTEKLKLEAGGIE